MCVDCNPLESNTGVIHYSGPNLELCNGVSITNGELLTSVIAKFDNCIGALQNQLDITGLIENSPCIDLVQTSLKTVLQSILDAQSDFCTQLQALNNQITNLQNQVNNLEGNKVISITACDPSRVQVTSDTSTQKSFKINGLVPPKTILPYFGLPTDFGPTGLGLSNGPVAGWAIANGQSHTIGGVTYTTINALNNFIKYGPSAITTPSGSNTVTLDAPNIPEVGFTVNANFDLNFTGETDLDGKHRHKFPIGENDCGNCNDGIPSGDPTSCQGAGINTESSDIECYSDGYCSAAGEHSHTFTINSTATGSFNAVVGTDEPESFSVVPVHIQAIPIQWLGCS
jgi:hypothetical protein